jgi:transglutaminase-like putative cysteine protease
MDHAADRALSVKWRGAALSEFDGRAWFNRASMGQLLRPDPQGLISLGTDDERRRQGRFISYAVYLNDLAADSLFFAGSPEFLRIDSTVVRRPFDNYSVQFPETRSIWYQAYSRLEPSAAERQDSEPIAPLAENLKKIYLQLPPIDSRIEPLARRITGSASEPMAQARLIEKYLSTQYGYTLELPSSQPADPLAFFLFQRRKGHCEYFASAMAVMLRAEGIPSRVVTGFQSGVYNPVSKSILVRTSDAHSWVEAWISGRGWTTFDPTPPDPNPPQLSFWTRLGFYVDAAGVFWNDWVLNYNLDRQLQLAARVGDASRNVTLNWLNVRGFSWGVWWSDFREFTRRNGAWLGALAVAGLLILSLAPGAWRSLRARLRVKKLQSGRAEACDATVLYRRLLANLKRRGIEKPAWLTPSEFANVLQEPELSLLVEDLTAAYNELRFGGRPEAAIRLLQLLERLEAIA